MGDFSLMGVFRLGICVVLMHLSVFTAYGQTEPEPFVSTLAGTDTQGVQDGARNIASFNSPLVIANDTSGNTYVADTWNHKIRKITPSGEVSTFAGSGAPGSFDGKGTAASFNLPIGIAVDAEGYVYVADFFNNKIRKITPAGEVSTLAGSGTVGAANGTGSAASFNRPYGIALDTNGNAFVTDTGNHRIRKITPSGVVFEHSGPGKSAVGADGKMHQQGYGILRGIAVDRNGIVYVTETYDNYLIQRDPTRVVLTDWIVPGQYIGPARNYYNTVRKVELDGSSSSLATNAAAGYNSPGSDRADPLNFPLYGLAIDGNGLVYVADTFNKKIRKITPDGKVTTFADANTLGNTANFQVPVAVSADILGNIYVADNNKIRRIHRAYVVNTVAGSGQPGSANGAGAVASFNRPEGIAVDHNENVYVADTFNHLIRKISRDGTVTTLAGSGTYGAIDATGTKASFYQPLGVAVDSSENVYVADSGNGLIRKINRMGVVSTLLDSELSNRHNMKIQAKFHKPAGVAVDIHGNVYVADQSQIYKITATGVVVLLAGSKSTGSSNGEGTAASFLRPFGIAVDAAGNVYVADFPNNMIRKITPTGAVSTLAGVGSGFRDGVSSKASFAHPYGVAVDANNNVYVSEYVNNRIRKISPAGVVSTLAGSGVSGSLDGVDIDATFSNPLGLALGPNGNIYVGDFMGAKIRKISPMRR